MKEKKEQSEKREQKRAMEEKANDAAPTSGARSGNPQVGVFEHRPPTYHVAHGYTRPGHLSLMLSELLLLSYRGACTNRPALVFLASAICLCRTSHLGRVAVFSGAYSHPYTLLCCAKIDSRWTRSSYPGRKQEKGRRPSVSSLQRLVDRLSHDHSTRLLALSGIFSVHSFGISPANDVSVSGII